MPILKIKFKLLISLVLFSLIGFTFYQTVFKSFTPNRKILEITGVKRGLADKIRATLPKNRSKVWWFLNRDLIELQLKGRTELAAARLTLKKMFFPTSFTLELNERVPYLKYFYLKEGWMISSDGVFLERLNKLSSGDKPNFIDNSNSAPSADVVRGRLKYTINAIENMQLALDLKPQELTYSDDRRLKLKFAELDFPIVFSLPTTTYSDAKIVVAPIEEQIGRLSRLLLSKTPSELKRIREIDFGFNKLAVIKYRKL
jgi:hypothetical protein